jgi:hypothetical protein
MSDVTDRNTTQAALLIAALRDELGEMIPKLAWAEREAHEATCGRTSRARALRREAVRLRCDVGQAEFLIARLQHRFPGADTEPTPQPRQTAREMPAHNGSHVRPAATI